MITNQKAVSAKDVARYFILKSQDFRDVSGITNLHLQKLLFYAQAEFYQQESKPLFKEAIEAWRYGPVVKVVYDWLKHCGGYPIIDFDIDNSDRQELDKDIESFLNKIWHKYYKYSTWILSEKIHQGDSVWSKIYKDGEGVRQVIPNNCLKEAILTVEAS